MDTPAPHDERLTRRTFTHAEWEQYQQWLLSPAGKKAEEERLRQEARDQARYAETTREEGYQRNRAWDQRQIWLHSEEGQAAWRAEQHLAAARRSELEHLDVLEREAITAAVETVKGEFTGKRLALALEWLRQDAKARR